eukprot:CAMPEP_0205868986 /NCGR_PEP_ID=MMETSP1083-20121108/9773_1 /ASSEMBLY_ACC=CAM_ASM_000430 /TAXON_ID=97485 /ORGANISM="Prymnesium parvum, Strain Texoma1" /LENGTH=44 /DNA_ID= /DNA_START= /DNA_END= /DNA_ORIENTATION=
MSTRDPACLKAYLEEDIIPTLNLRDMRNNLAYGQLLVDHLDHLH